jgi:Zn-dependent protease
VNKGIKIIINILLSFMFLFPIAYLDYEIIMPSIAPDVCYYHTAENTLTAELFFIGAHNHVEPPYGIGNILLLVFLSGLLGNLTSRIIIRKWIDYNTN